MPEIKDVLDDVQREVKKFGEDVGGLKSTMERDLSAVRKLAEEAGAKAGDNSQLKNDLKALTEGVAAKHEAIEKAVKDILDKALAEAKRVDEVERRINRSRLGGNGAGDDAEMKGLRGFHRTALSVKGQLKPDTDLSDEKIDVEAIKSYGRTFGSYLRRDDRSFDAAQAKSMSIGSDPDGGYLVTPAMGARILTISYETSPIRELATVETISTDAIEYPTDDGEAGAGWVGETETRSDSSTPQVGVQRIPVHELYAMPKATQKLLEDASIDVESWLAQKIGAKFGRLEATAFVSGNGIKKPRGFTSYANGATRGFIEQIVSGNATVLTADGLINLTMALKEPYAPNAQFLMRRATVGAVMLLKDGTGRYLWMTGLEGRPSTLLNHPVRYAADLAAVGAGTLPIAFGDFRQGYTIVDRLGVSTLRDPYTAKPFVVFYTRKRVGGDVTNFEAIKLQVVST